MAALMTLSQLSNGNLAYENYYRQLDPLSTGKVSAGDAAQFLKKSGLSDSTLGKIWDLADYERRGYLDKKGFFVALRLVASAQSGNDISLNNLTQTLAAPKFRDTSSPSLPVSSSAPDSQWAIRAEEKGKFEGIFESLSPVNGLLSGDKVKPVLINSKLPLDILGKIWDLSDVDKDGSLDKDEFIVAMHLVYRAMEKEPVPATLPQSLIPPSKRKKIPGALPGAVAVLPGFAGFSSGSALLKDTLRSTPPLANTPPPTTASISPKHSFKSSPQPAVNWVVPLADRDKYNDLFKKTDADGDGLVTGAEVIEIFMQSTLSQTMLAQIWGLADTKQTGKLNREQFSLAMHLIHQKISKDLDPPSTLSPDMIPPSERTGTGIESSSSVGPVELTGNKELDDLNQEIARLQRDKFILEQEIGQKEDSIRRQNSEVQNMQGDVERESVGLQDLETQKQSAHSRLDEMEQQRAKLEGMLNDVKQKCQEESQMISSLQSQIRSQESDMRSKEDDVSRTKAELSRLQEEEARLEQSLLSGRVQLESIAKSMKSTHDELGQARSKLSMIQENQKEVSKTIEQYNSALKELNGGNYRDFEDVRTEGYGEKENRAFGSALNSSLKSRIAMFNSSSTSTSISPAKDPPPDPFQTEDPFKSSLLDNPFGGDPFKESYSFKGTASEDFFKRPIKSDPFVSADPFGRKPTPPAKPSAFSSSSSDPFRSNSLRAKDSDVFATMDPFAGSGFGTKPGFADFSQMGKPENPLAPRKSAPSRPAPPYGSFSVQQSAPHSGHVSKEGAQFFGNESAQLEWAKRESEREEQERLRRLRLQEQQDLELALALSRADIPAVQRS
ncbi:unnamed protein product [Knipowitschia caucasica]|uniref:Epidermal growth factor receptor substrate 15-like 1 n=1 Tax=Knipowitschia caucasica TaxID=637954 RepID=A0AAV2JUG6_KNICA